MLTKIRRNITEINKAIGIEVVILEDNKYLLNACVVVNKKGNVSKEKQTSETNSIATLKTVVGHQLPVSLVINGESVLVTEVDNEFDNNIQTILPNANPDDFYVEHWDGLNTKFVAVVRKTVVEEILDQFKHHGFKVVSISLGFAAINNALPFFRLGIEETIQTNSFLLKVSDNEVQKFDRTENQANNNPISTDYTVGNVRVGPFMLLAFSAGIGLLAADLLSQNPIRSESVSWQRKEYINERYFRASGFAFLGVIFIALLVNFLLYTSYFNKNRQFTSQISNSQREQKIYLTIENEVKQKEKFLQRFGWQSSGRISLYADRIASVTPSEITLSSMHIYPIRKSISNDSKSNFRRDTILIQGKCLYPTEVTQFIENLKIMPEVKNVTLKNYQYRNENEIGTFSMEIITR